MRHRKHREKAYRMKTASVIEMFQNASALFLTSGEQNARSIQKIARSIIACFKRGNKMLLCGNGGSASQAQHFAAEFVNKIFMYRKALPAVALTTDTSVLTSIGNDIAFDDIFSRQVEALGRKGDILWGLTTSGTSPNVIKALAAAKKGGLTTICFAGSGEKAPRNSADMLVTVPSKNTARIQEVHLCAGHAVCEIVENHFLRKNPT